MIPPAQLKTPVLFLVFNRPNTTEKVFEAIREIRPRSLYISADGPRESREYDALKVAKVREIVSAVDWQCEVKTLFRERNLGCKKAVSEGISWFFEQEERGIILEDDCVPHPDFFMFCESLLSRYALDERVAAITGNNFQDGIQRGEGSYYFSRYNHVWGWASWRRAWQHADMEIKFWREWKESSAWRAFWTDTVTRRFWESVFDRVYRGEIDTWDYPWTASLWYNGGLTVTPNVNLVSNIGFGEDATHTSDETCGLARMRVQEIGPICHPSAVQQDREADRYTFDNTFGGRELRISRFPLRILKMMITVYNKSKGLLS